MRPVPTPRVAHAVADFGLEPSCTTYKMPIDGDTRLAIYSEEIGTDDEQQLQQHSGVL